MSAQWPEPNSLSNTVQLHRVLAQDTTHTQPTLVEICKCARERSLPHNRIPGNLCGYSALRTEHNPHCGLLAVTSLHRGLDGMQGGKSNFTAETQPLPQSGD